MRPAVQLLRHLRATERAVAQLHASKAQLREEERELQAMKRAAALQFNTTRSQDSKAATTAKPVSDAGGAKKPTPKFSKKKAPKEPTGNG